MKKCLWIQTWFNNELVNEVRVADTESYKTGNDVLAIDFLNNNCLKLVWK